MGSMMTRLALTRGPIRAFVELVRRYGRLHVRQIGFGAEDAEDIRRSLSQCLRRLPSSTRASASSWIYRIVHNRTVSEYRKRKRSLQDISVDDDPTLAERLFPTDGGAVEEAEASLTSAAIAKVLALLPDRDRDVLVLAYIEGKKYEEIGDILRVPMGTVATWISRAKRRFRDKATEAGIQL
jgi:RNA polymerase sigma-70 factor (ECF subfamily)